MNKIASDLTTSDSIQLAVCGLHGRKKGNSTKLDETTVGIVLASFGEQTPIAEYHTNFFSFENDMPVIDDATGKPLNETQKPVKFMEKLIQLYSSPGDWILDGLGGIGRTTWDMKFQSLLAISSKGTTLIAAANLDRNSIVIENNSLLYINAKIQVVKALQNATDEVEEGQNEENEKEKDSQDTDTDLNKTNEN